MYTVLQTLGTRHEYNLEVTALYHRVSKIHSHIGVTCGKIHNNGVFWVGRMKQESFEEARAERLEPQNHELGDCGGYLLSHCAIL